jgi:hypothetical protein
VAKVRLHTIYNTPCRYDLGSAVNMFLSDCIVRTTQGKGVMPDGTSRFKCKGKDILHFVRICPYHNQLRPFQASLSLSASFRKARMRDI